MNNNNNNNNNTESMAEAKPLYVDFTWGAGGSTSDLTLELAIQAKKRFGLEPNMHLTCTNMPKNLIDEALKGAKEGGIRNIVALRGDPPKDQEDWKACESGFSCALDLVKYIRKEYDDYFCISVAGYPEGHPNVIKPVEGGKDGVSKLSKSEKTRLVVIEEENEEKKTVTNYYVCSDSDFAKEIAYLKSKVDAGADLIITQMFFEPNVFIEFVKACRGAGIKVPIIPGIMLIQAYGGFCRMTKFCKSCVPKTLKEELEKVKDVSKDVKKLGTKYGVELSTQLLKAGVCPVLHYYTLNLERVVMEVLKDLNLYEKNSGKKLSLDESKGLPSNLRDNKLSETVEDLACRMQKGTILSESRDEFDAVEKK